MENPFNLKRSNTSPSVDPKVIHVVEDDAFWRLAIKRAVQCLNVKVDVTFSKNIREARHFIDHHRKIDLIISDHHFSDGETSLHLWQHLKNRSLHIPFIIFSGIDKNEVFKKIDIRKQPRFIEKSKSLGEFSKAIRHFLTTETKLRGIMSEKDYKKF